MLHTAYTLTVHFVAKDGQESELLRALSALVAPTRAESGCLLYTLHQSSDTPTEFLFYEAWVDQAAHLAHGKTPHMQQWKKKRDALVASCKVSHWQALAKEVRYA